MFTYLPVNMPHSDSHPVRIGWEVLARSGQDDPCTLACFRTGSVWPKPDTVSQNQTGSGLVLHSFIRDVCGRTELSLKVENWQRAGCVLPESGPDDSCTPACFQTRCVCPNPDQAIQTGSGSVLRSMIHALFGKTELKRLLAGRNGHNWP